MRKDSYIKNIVILSSLLVGVLFLFSSIGKALDVRSFSSLISEYGFDKLKGFAPLVILFEAIIGLCLILFIRVKKAALLSIITLIIFTIAYSYAFTFYAVEDCGCFGNIDIKLTPTQFYLRNILLIGFSFFIYKYAEENKEVFIQKKRILILSMLILTYMTGFSYKSKIKLNTQQKKNKFNFIGKKIEHTPLSNYIQASKDSTYLVYFFSYKCPHCLNSMENIKKYVPSGTVDRVILIGKGNKSDKNKLIKDFNIKIPILNIDTTEMDKITSLYPVSYFIVNDTVKYKLTGTLPVYQNLIKKLSFD